MPDRPENRKIDDDVRILNEKLQECELHLLVQVNERKQAEESMLKNEQKIRALFNETFQFVGLLTPDGVLVEVNRAALEFSGFEIDSVLNKPFWQGPWWAHSPELQEKLRQSVEKVARGEFVRFEATHVAKDGSLHYIDFSLKPVWDGVGNVVYMIPEGRDVTEHKMAEEERNKLLFWQQGINLLHQSLLMPAPLEDKLKLITDSIVRLFDVDFARIWLIRPGDLCEKGCTHTKNTNGAHVCNYHEKCLHLLSSSGRYTSIDGKIHRRVPFGCYKIGLIASGQEHKFVTNDVSNDPQVHNHEWARELGLVSFAGYQLKVLKGDILGVLALFAKHAISESEDILLDALSNTTAFIVQQGMAQRDL
ncbi:MAG: PAS domain S-box protein, partial [Candidatus Omnitrophota bacterium]